jgi:hypothetical protein
MPVTAAAIAVVGREAALRACVTGRFAITPPAATAPATPSPATSPASVFAAGGVAITRRGSLVTAVTLTTRFIDAIEPFFAICTIGAADPLLAVAPSADVTAGIGSGIGFGSVDDSLRPRFSRPGPRCSRGL